MRERHDRDDITRFCRAWRLDSNWTDELFNGDISDTTTQPPGSSDARRDLSKKARSFTTTTPTTHDRGAGHRFFFFQQPQGNAKHSPEKNSAQQRSRRVKQHMASASYESSTTTRTPPGVVGTVARRPGGLSGRTFQRVVLVSAVFPDFYEILQLTRTQDVVLGGFNKTTESAFFFFFFLVQVRPVTRNVRQQFSRV